MTTMTIRSHGQAGHERRSERSIATCLFKWLSLGLLRSRRHLQRTTVRRTCGFSGYAYDLRRTTVRTTIAV